VVSGVAMWLLVCTVEKPGDSPGDRTLATRKGSLPENSTRPSQCGEGIRPVQLREARQFHLIVRS
jgi:hypothetical protein